MMYEMMLFCFSGLSSFFFSFDDDDDDDDEHFPFLWNGQLGCHLSFGSKFQSVDFRCWKFFRCSCSDSNRFVLMKESETKKR